jgi:hypothetical protein
MTVEETFLKEGAWYHCARLIYKNQDVGLRAEDGTLSLTMDGEEIYKRISDITDVEIKPARKAKVKVEEVPVNVDDLLA